MEVIPGLTEQTEFTVQAALTSYGLQSGKPSQSENSGICGAERYLVDSHCVCHHLKCSSWDKVVCPSLSTPGGTSVLEFTHMLLRTRYFMKFLLCRHDLTLSLLLAKSFANIFLWISFIVFLHVISDSDNLH